jgi:Cellulose binding domain/Glycosyl hydrolase family 12
MRRRAPAMVAGVAAVVAAVGAAVITAHPASAATGCRIDYAIASQWPGGFGANVTLTNLGDALSSWTVTWSYSAGQQVTQYWNATITQSGSQVTAKNVSYNGSVATGGTTSFGFNGSWTSSNPVPSSFALNGVTCTGGVSPGTPTPTRTTASPTPTRTVSPTPSRTSASPTPTSGTPGVPSDAAWVATGQWDNWTNNGYTINNDVWGSGAGPQTIWARTGTNWGVIANHPMTSGVKSYPHTGRTLNRTVSSLGSLTSSFNVSVPSSGNWETAYDIWANSNAYEVMLWVNQNGAVGPIADSYDANGAVPAFKNVSVGGQTWNVYKGNNGSNAVYSFLRTSNTNSGSVDVLAVLTWLRTQGWWADVTIGDVQFGFEISGTNGSSAFTDNSFAVTYN